ncbi:MAG: glycoside hydrolase family 95 protein [Luteolibacter sp.]
MNLRPAFLSLLLALQPSHAGEKDIRFTGTASAPAEPLSLWYRRPAGGFTDALALGNGRLGAMVYGKVQEERIVLNEDTLWSGGPYNPATDVPPETLAEIRRLLFEGKNREAQNLSNKLQGTPNSQSAYQTLGELTLTFPETLGEVSDYRRTLDLDSAVSTVTCTAGGVRYTREIFVSPVDQVVVIRLTADQSGKISVGIGFTTPQTATISTVAPDVLLVTGNNGDMATDHGKGRLLVKSALTFQGRTKVLAEGGKTTALSDSISIAGADAVTLLFAANTSYKNYRDTSGDPTAIATATLAAVRGKTYADLRRAHIAEHQRLFRRVSLDLGASANAALPTDERLRAYAQQPDPALAALYFQFGRYLLMSSSRPGSQPANLQGIWNDKLSAAWDGKYTVNINTEMNYWPAQTTNLAETEEPLFKMIAEIAAGNGTEVARRTYHAEGWVLHHNTDLWRPAAPIDSAFWGQWPTGGAWFCNHLYQHYLFSGDKAYLARLYPIMKGSARFFEQTLVKEPAHGWLVTAPSNSPEHEYEKGISVTYGPAMDMQILRELFASCIQASQALGSDADLRKKWQELHDQLAPNQIGAAGQLQEWIKDWDLTAQDIKHRHMSPFYGIFPGNDITPADPKIFAATRKLAEMREAGGMGWANAWRIGIWARLLDGEKAGEFVDLMITKWTEKNFFDKPSVQLDGNYGSTAGIAEMLLQSHTGEIQLLPALPSRWSSGKVSGLLARGGYQISLEWNHGELTKCQIDSRAGMTPAIRYQGKLLNPATDSRVTLKLLTAKQ